MLQPKLFTTLKGYSLRAFWADAVSGVIVGIVALPLAIAFAIASGVPPEKGLITAVVAGFLISALGGSRVQIGGPTGAFVVLVYGIVHQYGINGLIVATFMAGIILIVMGLARLGAVIKFIPHPVIVGFTSGIAVIILSSQIRDFFGLTVESVPAEFFEKMKVFAENFHTVSWPAAGLGAATVAILYFWPKFVSRKVPGSIVALILCSVAVPLLGLDVETIGSRFGSLPNHLPAPALPHFDFAVVKGLFMPALAIALLGGIESLLSAVIADGMVGGKHRPNMELVAQGAANVASALFGGIPATGAIARTATNIKNGGRTPVAGIIHSLTLLVILLAFGKTAEHIPMACLAGILVMVAYHMSEWRSFLALLRSPRSDVAVLLVTFGLTVMVDLVVAINVGVVLASLLFIRRMSEVANVGAVTREMSDEEEKDDPQAVAKRKLPDGVEVYEISGPFFFGAAYKFLEAMNVLEKKPKVRIIRMRNVLSIDATGIQAVKTQWRAHKRQGIAFLIAGLHAQPLATLDRAGILELIGEENLLPDIDAALVRAREIMALPGNPKSSKI